MALFNYFNHIAKVPSIETEIEEHTDHGLYTTESSFIMAIAKLELRGREYWSFLRDIEVVPVAASQ